MQGPSISEPSRPISFAPRYILWVEMNGEWVIIFLCILDRCIKSWRHLTYKLCSRGLPALCCAINIVSLVYFDNAEDLGIKVFPIVVKFAEKSLPPSPALGEIYLDVGALLSHILHNGYMALWNELIVFNVSHGFERFRVLDFRIHDLRT